VHCNLLRQDFNGIVADDPRVGQLSFLQAQHEVADARSMDLDTKITAFGMSRGLSRQIVTVTEADFESDRRGRAEHRWQVQQTPLKRDAVFGPKQLERALLRRGESSTAHYE
jgi:hypothetical protein